MIKRIQIRLESLDSNEKPLGPDIRHEYYTYVSQSPEFPTLMFISIFPITAAPIPDPAHYPVPADTPMGQIGGEVAMKLQTLPGNENLHLHPPTFSDVENQELKRVIDGFGRVLMEMSEPGASGPR